MNAHPNGEGVQPIIDNIDGEYGNLSLLERVIEWVETDPDGILRQTQLNHYPDINA